MKYRHTLLLILAIFCVSFIASAAIRYSTIFSTEEESSKSTFNCVSISPDQGEVAVLPQTIQLTFPDEVGSVESTKLGVIKDGSKKAAVVSASISDEDPKVVVLSIVYMIAEKGVYTFTIPEGFVHNNSYDVPEWDEYNGEMTFTYNYSDQAQGGEDTPKDDSEVMKKAKELLALDGIGYPNPNSESRLALNSLIEGDEVPTDEMLQQAVDAYLAESDICLPNVDGWYFINALSRNGKKAYLSYDNQAVNLTASVEDASAFKILSPKEGALCICTSDGKYLHVFSDGGGYKETSTANVTDSYISLVNDLSVVKYVDSSDPLFAFGKMNIKGSLGTNRKGEVSADDYSMVDFAQMQGYSVKVDDLEFSDLQSCVFEFTETVEPVVTEVVKLEALLSETEIYDIGAPLAITVLVNEKLALTDNAVAYINDASNTHVQEILLVPAEKTNQYSLSLEPLEDGDYKVVIPAKTFSYTKDGINYVVDEITIPFVKKTPQLETEAVCVLHEDFEHGMPTGFTMIDNDQNRVPESLTFPSDQAWSVWDDPDDSNNKVIAALSFYEPRGVADDWLISPTVLMPQDASACHLYFRSRSAFGTYQDGFSVYATTVADQSALNFDKEVWELVEQVIPVLNPTSWRFRDIDLSKYAGKNMQFAIVQDTNDGWMVYIDDLYLGNEQCIKKGQIRLTNDAIAYNSLGEVTFDVKCGIRDNIGALAVRLTSGDDGFSQTFDHANITPSEIKSFKLDRRLTGEIATRKDFKVELLLDGNVVSADSSAFIFAAPLPDARKKMIGEIYMNSSNQDSHVALEAESIIAREYANTMYALIYHGPDTDLDDLCTPAMLSDNLNKTYGIYWSRDILIDRKAKGHAVEDIKKLVEENKSSHILADASMGTAICSDDSLDLMGKITLALNAGYRPLTYRFVLLEDSLSSEKLNGEILNSVVRIDTIRGVIPDTLKAGMTYNCKASIAYPSNVKEPRYLSVVLIVMDAQTGEILNADRMAVTYTGTKPFNTAISSSQAETIAIENRWVRLGNAEDAHVTVMDVQGQVLYSQVVTNDIDLSTIVSKPQIVIVKVRTNNGVICKKLMINR